MDTPKYVGFVETIGTEEKRIRVIGQNGCMDKSQYDVWGLIKTYEFYHIFVVGRQVKYTEDACIYVYYFKQTEKKDNYIEFNTLEDPF